MASGEIPDRGYAEQFWKAPLVAPALLITFGILFDRYFAPPLIVSLGLASLSLIAWMVTPRTTSNRVPLVYLGLAVLALAAGYHHFRRSPGDLTAIYPNTALVQIRGYLDEEPVVNKNPIESPLRAIPSSDSTRLLVRVNSVFLKGQWLSISDRVVANSTAEVIDIHLGDSVEMIGQLLPIPGPKNPGESDPRVYYRDQGIHQRLQVRSGDSIVLLQKTWPFSLRGWLTQLSRWSAQQFALIQGESSLHGLSVALILGDASALPPEEWQRYQRTGVIQVLVVSGQHLLLIAGVLLWILQRAGVSLRNQAISVGLFLFLYVIMTGGRPPGMRSFIMMSALFASWILVRNPHKGNMMALSWIGVAILNPMDLFSPGCQLSFLCVLVIYYISIISEFSQANFLDRQDPQAFHNLLHVNAPIWVWYFANFKNTLVQSIHVSGVVWLAITPLVAYHYNNIAPVALLLNPILNVLTSFALFFGFLVLVLAGLHLPGTGIFVLGVNWALGLTEGLVKFFDPLPFASLGIPSPPLWWITPYLIGLIVFLTLRRCLTHPRNWLIAATAWVLIGLSLTLLQPRLEELTCTFLAVGHGTCIVIETGDGRTFLYDVGSLGGPPLTKRQVIPFLWHRGIRRIDEVILSHADLDHFNGLVDLMDRFAVGQITTTPTFADKEAPGVVLTLQRLQERKIPVRIVMAGDILKLGPGITIEVLHPPAHGPPGKENNRSLTLRIQASKSSLLLTGDLEAEGLEQFLKLNSHPVDVLMAPHHGSRLLDSEGLVKWARPRLVISTQGPVRSRSPEAYSAEGRVFWMTEEEGAITLHFHSSGIVADTFLTNQKLLLPAK